MLPCRLYQGAVGAQYRYFPHKLPLALDSQRATFVFVQAENETESAVRTWGAQHAKLWAALSETGRAVEVVVVGRDPVRLSAAERVRAKWSSSPPGVGMNAEEAAAELESIRAAIATCDWAAREVYGGLNPALQHMVVLEAARIRQSRPAITKARTWRSMRVPT